MLKMPGNRGPMRGVLPVQNRLGNEKVKQGIVGSGNGPAQARLFRMSSFPADKMDGLFQQLIGKH